MTLLLDHIAASVLFSCGDAMKRNLSFRSPSFFGLFVSSRVNLEQHRASLTLAVLGSDASDIAFLDVAVIAICRTNLSSWPIVPFMCEMREEIQPSGSRARGPRKIDSENET